MKIATKVSTQIILNEDELKEAAIEYIKARTTLPSNATFTVEFADDHADNLVAVIDIVGTEAIEPSKPKTGRKAANAASPAPVAAVAEPAAEPETAPEKPNISVSPEERVDPENPPFESEPSEETKPEPAPVATASPAPAPKRIFPDPTTSAPNLAVVEENPEAKARSLFANLSRPSA